MKIRKKPRKPAPEVMEQLKAELEGDNSPSPTNPLPQPPLPNLSASSPSLAASEEGEIVFNLTAIEEAAERLDIDAMLDDDTSPKVKKRKKPAAAAGSSSKLEEVHKVEHDPDFDLFVMFAASKGIDMMKDTFHLIEPGTLTRQRVAKSLSRLVERYKPVEPGPLADILCIGGYLGVWVLTGRIEDERAEPGREKSQTDIGDHGDRKDDVSVASPEARTSMFSFRPNVG